MRYIHKVTNQVVTIEAIRRENPNVSIPSDADCSSLGYDFLVETPRPEPLAWHRVVEGTPSAGKVVWIQYPMSEQEIIKELEQAVDAHIESVARADGWDSKLSCSVRAAGNGPWKAKGLAYVNWMDTCYQYCYMVMDSVKAGRRTIPTKEQLIRELPPMVWPK